MSASRTLNADVEAVLRAHDWFTPRGYAWSCCTCGIEFPDGEDAAFAHVAALLTTRNTAADAVLAEARQLCCGENPSAHHAASAKHSELMAFAGDLARAVRGL